MNADFSPQEWGQIKDLFAKARESKPFEHGSLLSNPSIPEVVLNEVLRLLGYKTRPKPVPEPPILKDYTDLTLIGVGMNRVYKAHDRETGETVAIKILDPTLAGQPEWLKRFKTEVVLARKVTHDNVCRVHNLITEGGVIGIAMEYVDGQDMATLLRRFHGIAIPQGLNIARQIAAGLAKAHAEEVIHRDLKPANILITTDGVAKILDFGIARSTSVVSTYTASGQIIGTPAYMSPEQADGKPAGSLSDIYSLGLVLYELFCGRPAFESKDVGVAEMLRKQVHETPKNPIEVDPYLPPFINRIILKCIEKDPAKRYQSAAELEAALAEREEMDTIVGDFDAQIPLPVELSRWQRADWLLTAFAILAVALFFAMAQRTNIASRIRVQSEPAALVVHAENFARTAGADIKGRPELLAISHSDRYDYLTSRIGTSGALELSDNPVPYIAWQARWDDGTVARLNNQSLLLSLDRPVTGNFENISIDDGKRIAEDALRKNFHVDPASLKLESSGVIVWQDQPAMYYTWSDTTDYHGLRRPYVVRLIGKQVASLDSDFSTPPDYVQPNLVRQLIGYILLPIGLLCIGVFQRYQVHLRSRWRIVLAMLSSLMIGRLFWLATGRLGAPPNLTIGVFLHTMIGFSVIMFFILVALERAIHKIGPHKLTTTSRLFGRTVTSVSCGLAVLRGTLIGLTVLGIDSLLVWVATRYLGMSINGTMLTFTEVYLNSPLAGIQRALFAVLLAPLLAAYMGWLGSLALGLTKRAWQATVLSTVAVVAILPIYHILPTASLLQPTLAKLPLLFLEIVIVMWAFVRFDFLTLLASLATFLFCSGSYFALQLLPKAPQEVAMIGAWLLVVCAAVAITFQSQIGILYDRLRSALQ